MAAPRLTFLYPAFFRSTSSPAEQRFVQPCLRPKTQIRAPATRTYRTSARHSDDGIRPQRYGSANEPLHPPPEQPSDKAKALSTGGAAPLDPDAHADPDQGASRGEPTPSNPETQRPPPPSHTALETVLHLPSPMSGSLNAHDEDPDQPPHMRAPRYVHHFDTWTLVRDLEKGGFTQEQSITMMKAVRNLLADNMDLAQRGLVSKSNVENVRGVRRVGVARHELTVDIPI